MDKDTQMGFVCILGAPNAGKSTLLNTLTGSKVSIVTYKPQTTRARVIGIVTEGTAQIAFIDTPGVFKPERRLDRAMVNAAWAAVNDADDVICMVDASNKALSGETKSIIAELQKTQRKAILVLNKIDAIDKPKLLLLADELHQTGVFTDIFMISALKNDGVDDLKKHLLKKMPQGPWMYPEDQLTDMSERLLAAEITREQVFLQLHQELPYGMTVETESWEDFDDGSVKIGQVIYVPRENHKPMVLGKGGQQIKRIGESSRIELEKILGHRVHLGLFVKVRENWMDDPERYATWGLDFKA